MSCALRKSRSAAADQDARDGLPQGDVRQLQESLLLLIDRLDVLRDVAPVLRQLGEDGGESGTASGSKSAGARTGPRQGSQRRPERPAGDGIEA